MATVKDGNHNPEERVNLVYKTDTGNETPQKELPLRMMVLGDFTGKPSDVPVAERKVYELKQATDFEKVMKAHEVSLNLTVPDVRDEPPAGSAPQNLPVALKFESMKDFEPDAIARKVPELKQLLDLRDALIELKGPLANDDKFRRKIQEILDGKKQSILEELGMGDKTGP